ncbi:MAG: hypothetical protein ABSC34_03840 [Acidimicrobiales bacterium]|jgi:hypothetical protein
MTWVSISISVLSALITVVAATSVYWQLHRSAPELRINEPVPLQVRDSPNHPYFSWEIWSTIGHVGRRSTEIKTVVCSLRVPGQSRPVIKIAMTAGNSHALEGQIVKPSEGLSVRCEVHSSDGRPSIDMETGPIYVPSGTMACVSVTTGTGRIFSSKEVALWAAPSPT